eukprot:TRINITY_DN9721_c0_g2_i2.p1 TRINITY_DN9721_c0_g2~~TRINITY_DN9721_c0_g2_i2.p1  ORF type:complete len:488 (-),score=86.51 TRINITY_DN9721_c0_g2_i2:78-1325(-)
MKADETLTKASDVPAAAEASETPATDETCTSTPRKSYKQIYLEVGKEFDVIDADSDGKINVGEFRNLLEKMQGLELLLELLQQHLQGIFEKYDSDGDGFIRRRNFFKMLLMEMVLNPERLRKDFDVLKGDDDYISAEDFYKVLLKNNPSADPEILLKSAHGQIDEFAVEPGKIYMDQFKPFWAHQISGGLLLSEETLTKPSEVATAAEASEATATDKKLPKSFAHVVKADEALTKPSEVAAEAEASAASATDEKSFKQLNADLSREFRVIDTESNREINVGDFRNLLGNLLEKMQGLEHLQQNVQGMFEKYDSDGDGFILEHEILQMILMETEIVLTPERLRKDFDIIKGDDDYISAVDLRELLLKNFSSLGLGFEFISKVAQEEIDEFAVVPGKIYIEQFKPFWAAQISGGVRL